jgi:2-haloacid dehalogenase
MNPLDPGGLARGQPRAVVFDLGGVLLDWDPRHLYRRLFDNEAEMEQFLAEVTTPAWNAAQDAGRPWSEAIEQLAREHPDERERIEAYRLRWTEMLAGEIPGSTEVLAEVRSAGVPVFALSNWSAETFPLAVERFAFLGWFDGIVISGNVGAAKPDRRIFDHLVARYGIAPAASVYVDDMPANVAAAAALGFHALQFRDAGSLREDLVQLGVLPSG